LQVVTTSAPVAEDQVPARQFVHTVAWEEPDHLPAGQTRHSVLVVAPLVALYFPEPHGCGSTKLILFISDLTFNLV